MSMTVRNRSCEFLLQEHVIIYRLRMTASITLAFWFSKFPAIEVAPMNIRPAVLWATLWANLRKLAVQQPCAISALEEMDGLVFGDGDDGDCG
jgi:hypothetical protein